MIGLAETYRTEERAEWANLLVMAALPGRRVLLRTVRRLGREAGIPRAEVDRVAAAVGAVS